jgi:hypothetical protein
VTVLGDGAFDRGHREGAFGASGWTSTSARRRIEAVEAQLRFQRITVRRERAGFHQQAGRSRVGR